MKIRLISGSVYVALLAVLFLLKIFLHDLFFDGFIWFCSLWGTFEMLRAHKTKLTKAEMGIVYAFASVCIPAVALCETFDRRSGASAFAVCFILFSVALLSLLVVRHEETTAENLGTALLSGVYPTALLAVLCLCNHFSASESLSSFAFSSDLAMLFVFVVSPVSDSLAYVFGRFLKKYFPKKMSPSVSPNKTVIGGIGGLVGGLIAGVVLYFSYNAVCGSFEKAYLFLPIYLGIGLLAAATTEFGDLVESSIKRKAEIKDMGGIMPGHGGVLDRIDGTMLSAVAIYAAFYIVRAIL